VDARRRRIDNDVTLRLDLELCLHKIKEQTEHQNGENPTKTTSTPMGSTTSEEEMEGKQTNDGKSTTESPLRLGLRLYHLHF